MGVKFQSLSRLSRSLRGSSTRSRFMQTMIAAVTIRVGCKTFPFIHTFCCLTVMVESRTPFSAASLFPAVLV